MGGPAEAVPDEPIAPVATLAVPKADETTFADVAPKAARSPAAGSVSPKANPVVRELDDEGCFSIGDEEVGSDFDELIAQASSGMQQPEPAAETLSECPTATASARTPDAEAKVDLLARMLESDGPDLAAGASGELATITEQIGLVVGGGEADQADRLYEMGMVYLEMGMFVQACDSFEAAAADAEFSARAHEMWGITLQRAQRPDEAIAVLARGLASVTKGSREQHGLLYHLGMAMEKTGQDDEAIECFSTINDMDPTYLDVGRRLAKLTSV
jgi:tetratricopeptide (TPR) repeat protein